MTDIHHRNVEIHRLYYEEGWTMKVIGDAFSISKARIGQILGRTNNARHRINAKLYKEAINQPEYANLTNVDISRHTGISEHTVRKYRNTLPPSKRSLEYYFLKRISIDSPNNCWLWNGVIHPQGYGHLRKRNANNIYAHQFSYEYFVGTRNGMSVLHQCGNHNCINPHHLYLGDAQDNANDRRRHGRHRGKVLNYELADKIRLMYKSGSYTQKELAQLFGVSSTTIYQVIHYRTYK